MLRARARYAWWGEPEVVAGYPDCILPRDADAAVALKELTLTALYNARPQWLANAHAALDAAVVDACGWGEDWRAGMADEEVVARLVRLNQARAGKWDARCCVYTVTPALCRGPGIGRYCSS